MHTFEVKSTFTLMHTRATPRELSGVETAQSFSMQM